MLEEAQRNMVSFLGSVNWGTIILSLVFWAAVVGSALWMVQQLFPDVRCDSPQEAPREH